MIDPMGSLVKLRKYHGLGNDFLVVLDVEGQRGAARGAGEFARGNRGVHGGDDQHRQAERR